jgi:transcriptional regulator with XRE-family HTH domain
MALDQRIAEARKQKGLTQEELADATNLTVRTIQRIESGESMPRSFTIKAIAAALDTNYEALTASLSTADSSAPDPSSAPVTAETLPHTKTGADKHLLELVCLSCFSFLVIPLLHFLIPAYLLRRAKDASPETVSFGRRLIKKQVYWIVALYFLLLVAMAYNFIRAAYFGKSFLLNYLWPFFIMYLLNSFLICGDLWRLKKHPQ